MKKSLILLGMLSIGYAHAQSTTDYDEKVGINTETPSATLNVKTKTDATSPKNLELENAGGTKLVTVLNNGNIGFRNDTPEVGLMIDPSNPTYFGNSVQQRIFRDTSIGAEYGFLRSRGTKEAPLTVKKGDEIVHNAYKVYTGAKYINAALITPIVTGDVTENTAPTSIDFSISKSVGQRQVMRLHHTGNLGIGRGVSTPRAPLHLQTDHEDFTDTEKTAGQKDIILIDFTYGEQNATTTERKHSIASISWAKKPNTYRAHSIDFGLINPRSTTTPFMAFRVAKQGGPSDTDTAIEHMRIMHTGNIGIGTTTPTHKLHIVADADPLKLEGLQEGTGSTLVVDANGVIKKGTGTASTVATNGVQNTTDMPCNEDNRGKMNFVKGENGKSDVFGICLRNKDGNYYWGYMVGGNNPTNGTGAFGSGL